MMRWSFQPLRYLKSAACVASIFTMCISPLAQAKAAQTDRQKVNELVKATGLSKGVTVGEFWKLVRHAYPKPLQGQLDLWVAQNRNQVMPKVEASTAKDRNGKEQIRLTMNQNGKNVTVTLTGDPEKPMKVNNVVLTDKELRKYKSYGALVTKIMSQDASMKKGLLKKPASVIGANPVLSFKEYAKLTPRQRAEYLFKVRMTVQAAQRVYKAKYGAQAATDLENKYQFAYQFLFGQDAEAAASKLTGKPCVYAGYLTLYGENGTCGGQAEGERHFTSAKAASIASCPGKDVPCHPMVYGYQANGSNYCIPHASRIDATKLCNEASPLKSPADKKRIIESYLAKRNKQVNLVLDADGKISEAQYAEISSYLADLNKYIKDAIGECDNDPLKSIQTARNDQKRACDAIRIRAFDLQAFATNPTPVILPPALPTPVKVDACEPGREVKQDGTCGPCQAGSEPVQGTKEDGTQGEVCSVIAVAAAGGELPGPKEEKKEDDDCDGFLCIGTGWWILGGALLAGGLLWAALRDKDDDDDDDKVATPPIAVDPGTPTPTPTPPVTVPDPECHLPKTIVDGVCKLVIDTLPPPATEGGSLEVVPGMGSGVR